MRTREIMKKVFWVFQCLAFGLFAVTLHAADAGYPTESQVLKDVNANLTKSKLENVKFTSGWALSWVNMSRKSFQPPDQAVCDVTITFVKNAQGEQGSSESVVYYTRDILKPNLPWKYQKIDILTSKLTGRADMAKDELTKLLLETLSGKDGQRAQALILPNGANLIRVHKVTAADPSQFAWKSRESMTYFALVEYDFANGNTNLDRRERVIRVGFEKRNGAWFMNDVGSGKDKTLKTTQYEKVELEKMPRLSRSTWTDIYKQ
jgi:hypothetical protein